ncbi:23S rRNA (uracil1939-C5)-methyltransferase [Desulfitispora alkaliphila]|uniref:23S rRNA (uracil(1939)-C(5))-methyltransferase RlmD n=1 Tax=Desulfitispora alkaliphila TaxID=622674 RepID=UPI003D2065F2
MTLKVGKEVILTIDNLTNSGAGVGRTEGFALFVPGALPGESVRVKVTKVKKKYGQAELVEILQESENRVERFCSEGQLCGGCQLEYMDYQAQLDWKQDMVRETLKRIGKISEPNVLPALGMENPLAYRNKVQLHCSGGEQLGFYQVRSKELVPLTHCQAGAAEFGHIIHAINRLLSGYSLKWLKHVILRQGNCNQVMVIFVTTKDESDLKALSNELISLEQTVSSIYHNINPKADRYNIYGECHLITGDEYIQLDLLGLTFLISPKSFFQVNTEQTAVLYQKAEEFLQLKGSELLLDAYCGTGTIALYLAKRAKEVLGIEVVPEAIGDAKKNSELNKIDNAQFITGKVENELPRLVEKGYRPDAVVLDPPRSGCHQQVLDAVAKAKPQRIVYVSCDVGTLSRDLNILQQQGYATQVVQPVDMFPHTSHVEVCCCLTRVK